MLKLVLRRLLVSTAQLAIRSVLYPQFAIADFKNRQVVARSGDVLSKVELSGETSGAFCVFHIFPSFGLPNSTKRAMDALRSLNVHLVVVSNLPLAPDDETYLRSIAHTIIVRRNIGRDFGGYRTGILDVLDRLKPTKLLIVNDSVFFRQAGLVEFFTEMLGPEQFIGAAENHEFSHHVGSYALSFGPKVLASPLFRSFWENYRLTEIRPQVIKHGEIALSRLIMDQIRVRPTVIYSIARLSEVLRTISLEELTSSLRLMPPRFRERRGRYGQTTWSRLLGDSVKAIQISEGTAGALIREAAAAAITEEILNFFYEGSQIHLGSVFLTKYLNCPVIKKDLVTRSVYGIGKCGEFKELLSVDEYAEFSEVLRSHAGPQPHWSIKRVAMWAVGYA